MKKSEKQRHESMQRLLAIALEVAKIDGPAALASALTQSEQTITNWGSRGVSKEGAMKAQEKFGCSANWVLHNMLPRLIGDETAQPKFDAEPARQPVATDLDGMLQSLSSFLAKAEPEDREALQGLLASLVRKPGDERLLGSIRLMLDSKAFVPQQKIRA